MSEKTLEQASTVFQGKYSRTESYVLVRGGPRPLGSYRVAIWLLEINEAFLM